MIYLNEGHLEQIGINWNDLVDVIRSATQVIDTNDYSQPVKPYLRFGDRTNRIIAMPAFVGGDINYAGIKWIASFPGNIHRSDGVPRANSVTILNDADTGQVRAIINTAVVSGIRTSAVTGYVIEEYRKAINLTGKVKVGMTGFGPIGQLHLSMVLDLLGDQVESVSIFDPRAIDKSILPDAARDKINIVDTWQDAYRDTDIFMACTVSDKPYIDMAPKKGSLQLNVSLRDYVPEYRQFVDVMLVDDWDEICRESTDVENMHKEQGLSREDAYAMEDLARGDAFDKLKCEDIVMFNPMGLAIYDIAVASYYYQSGVQKGIGLQLENESIETILN